MKKLLFISAVLISTISFGQTTLKGRDSLAQSADFVARVRMAALTSAQNVASDTSTTQLNRTKQRFASALMVAPRGVLISAVTYSVLTNPAITAASTDSDIQFTINSIWANLAKAYNGGVLVQ